MWLAASLPPDTYQYIVNIRFSHSIKQKHTFEKVRSTTTSQKSMYYGLLNIQHLHVDHATVLAE